MKYIWRNQKGIVIIQALLLVSILSGIVVTVYKNKDVLSNKISKINSSNNSKNNLQQLELFTSNTYNCEYLFKDKVDLNTSRTDLDYSVNLTQLNTKINGALGLATKDNYNVTQIVTIPSTTQETSSIVRGTKITDEIQIQAKLNYSKKLDNNVIISNEELPIVFSFVRDGPSSFSFNRCYSKSNDSTISSMNCTTLGGTYTAQNGCSFKMNSYDPATGPSVTSVPNLEHALCKLEKRLLEESGTDEMTKYCRTIQLGSSCQDSTGVIRNHLQTWQVDKGKRSSTWIKENVRKITSEGSAHSVSEVIKSLSAAGINMDGLQSSLPGTNGGSFSSSDNFAIPGAVVGALGGGALMAYGLAAAFGPAGILAGLIFGSLFSCGNSRAVYINNACHNGQIIVRSIEIKKKKRRGFRCKWRNDRTINTPSIGDITYAFTNDPNYDPTNLDEHPMGEDPASDEPPLTKEIFISELMSLKAYFANGTFTFEKEDADGNPIVSSTNNPLYGTIDLTNLSGFYELIKPSSNHLGLSSPPQMSLDVDNYWSTHKESIENLLKVEETSLWSSLKNDITTVDLTTNFSSGLNILAEKNTLILNNRNQVKYAPANVTKEPAQAALDAKLLEAKNSIINHINSYTSKADLNNFDYTGLMSKMNGSFGNSNYSNEINNAFQQKNASLP